MNNFCCFVSWKTCPYTPKAFWNCSLLHPSPCCRIHVCKCYSCNDRAYRMTWSVDCMFTRRKFIYESFPGHRFSKRHLDLLLFSIVLQNSSLVLCLLFINCVLIHAYAVCAMCIHVYLQSAYTIACGCLYTCAWHGLVHVLIHAYVMCGRCMHVYLWFSYTFASGYLCICRFLFPCSMHAHVSICPCIYCVRESVATYNYTVFPWPGFPILLVNQVWFLLLKFWYVPMFIP